MKTLFCISLLTLLSCTKPLEKPARILCTEYQFYNSGQFIDSMPIEFLLNVDSNKYEFKKIEINFNDTFTYIFETNDTNYLYKKKEYLIKGIKTSVIRIDNEKIGIPDSRAYIFLYENGRPICIKDRDWAKYFTYVSDSFDQLVVDEITGDTTCFFKCIVKEPLPPKGIKVE